MDYFLLFLFRLAVIGLVWWLAEKGRHHPDDRVRRILNRVARRKRERAWEAWKAKEWGERSISL